MKKEKIKTVHYIRTATVEQAANQKIEGQKRRLDEFAKVNCKYQIIDSYVDAGISGTISLEKRPAGSRLLNDAREKRFDAVLVTDANRLGKDLYTAFGLVQEFSNLGIEVRSISDSFNTEILYGKLVFDLASSFYESEIKQRQERSKRGRQQVMEKHSLPYCYEVDEGTGKLNLYKDKVLLDKYSEVDVIKKIYGLYLNSRLTCEKIAEMLNLKIQFNVRKIR